jgi:hypothetical protein
VRWSSSKIESTASGSRDFLLSGTIQVLAILAMAIWLGGFTFYSAVVIPVLHEQFGSPLDAGLVTQKVKVTLNRIGAGSIGLAVLAAVFEPPGRRRFRAGWSLGVLAVSTACLAALFVLHRILDRKLESGELAGFYPIHRRYLWTSTVQWLANGALLAGWSFSGGRLSVESLPENSQVSAKSRPLG